MDCAMEWSCSWQHMSMASRDFIQMRLSCRRPTRHPICTQRTREQITTCTSKHLSTPAKHAQTQAQCPVALEVVPPSNRAEVLTTLLCASLTSASMTTKDWPSPFRTRKNSAFRGSNWNFCTKVFSSCSSVRATLGEFPKNDTNR